MPRNDVVVDANTMHLYGSKAAASHKAMFQWLDCCGSLCISQFLVNEYSRQGSIFVAALLHKLTREGRLSKIKNSTLRAFEPIDANYHYTCDTDRPVARTVFRSYRKLLVSSDQRLLNDVNGFPTVGGVKPRAARTLAEVEMRPRHSVVCQIHGA
jgi:hypothetical protein